MTETLVVTGAARGIGAAVARVLTERARSDQAVALLDRDAETLARTAQELRSSGVQVLDIPCDVRESAQVDAVFDRIDTELGPVVALAHVAAVLRPGDALEVSEADWDETFAVNAKGTMNVTRAAGRRMASRGRGAVVAVSSNAASIPRTGMAAYAASKAAATRYVLCLGLELAPHGVRCNVVSPGSTDTDMQRSLWADPSADAVAGAAAVVRGDLATFRTGIPLGRIADARDVAETVAFLLSDAARHVTLTDLLVDGGATLRH